MEKNNQMSTKTLGMNKKTIKRMHYFMLFIMLHITIIAPAQQVKEVYKETFNRLNLNENLFLLLPKSYTANAITNNRTLIKNNSFTKTLYKKESNTVLPPKSENNIGVTIIDTDLKEGVIGISKTIPMDNPMDNLFKFTINELPSNKDKVILKYDLFGVEDQNSVARSINERFSIGGHIIKINNQWSTQEEELNSDWLNMGENKILFTTEKGADYQYKIKNVHLEVIKKANENIPPLLVVQNTDIKFSKDNKIYIKGFVRDTHDENITIDVEGTILKQQSQEFEGFIDLNSDVLKKGFVVIRAYDSKGLLGQQLIALSDKLEEAQAIYSVKNKKTSKKITVKAFEKSKVDIEGASIEIVDSALVQSKQLSISELRSVDFAPLGSEITNVTKSEIAYRFLPDGTQFAKPISITISYDPKLLPFGYTAKDIKIFFFDTKTKTWRTVHVVSFDEKNNTITALTTHFTDYISGIIKVPESPETNAYTPTTMSGVKIANPGEKINLIQPPTANQQGDANLAYQIEIPSGRGGMQPNLSVNYNSANTNGWMGLGWNISAPSIDLDTRWGSPTFDPSSESEIYTLGGEQLLLNNDTSFYLANKSNPITRISNAFFYERVEGSFNKIQRIGDATNNYKWTITDKSGTVSTYGADHDAILTDNSGNIVKWMLNKVQDINGNYIEYFYTTKAFTDGTTSGGKQIYLQRIEYTKHATLAAPYSVVFNTTTAVPSSNGPFTRQDKSINARLGFKEITDDVLESIDVNYGAALVRKYKFIYKQGVFQKTLLDRIQQYDGAGLLFNEHTLDYYDYSTDDGGLPMFGPEQAYDNGLAKDVDGGILFNDILHSSSIGASHGSNWGGSLGFTIGYASIFNPLTLNFLGQDGTAGLTGGISGSNNQGKISLIDIDGDGLPDKLFQDGGQLQFRKNTGSGFLAPQDINTGPNFSDFSTSKTSSKSLGFRASFFGGFAGYDRSWTTTNINTFLEDVNGDGLIDVVSDSKVYFNTIRGNAIPTFNLQSSEAPNVIYQDASQVPTPSLATQDGPPNNVYDVVKVWEAPYNGTINITGSVSLNNTTSVDGVLFSIEKGNIIDASPTPIANVLNTALPSYPVTLIGSAINTINQSVSVSKGQRIFFRANSISNDVNDLINLSNLSISYSSNVSNSNTLSNASQLDANGLPFTSSSSTDGFIMSADQQYNAPYPGLYSITWPTITISSTLPSSSSNLNLSDEVDFIVYRHDIIKTSSTANPTETITQLQKTRVKVYNNSSQFVIPSIGSFNLSSADIYKTFINNSDGTQTLDTSGDVYFSFHIKSNSNVDWKSLDTWKPQISIPNSPNCNPNTPDAKTVYATPNMSVYNTIVTNNTFVTPPNLPTTGTTPVGYQMQPVFPVSSGVVNFGVISSSNTIPRELYISVKGSNKNLLFNSTVVPTTTATQQTGLAKYKIIVNNDGSIQSIYRYNYTNDDYITSTSVISTTPTNISPITICFNAHDISTLNNTVIRNDRVYFEYFTNDSAIANSLVNVPSGACKIKPSSGTGSTWLLPTSPLYLTQRVQPNIYIIGGNNNFGPKYRGWGQFAYKTEVNPSGAAITSTSLVRLKEFEMYFDPNTITLTQAQVDANNASINSCIASLNTTYPTQSGAAYDSAYQACIDNNNPYGNKRIGILTPNNQPNSPNWYGTQAEMYISDQKMSPKKQNAEDTTSQTPIPSTPVSNNTGAYGIIKQSKSTTNSISAGYGVSAYTTFGNFTGLNDFSDVNGDRYPDFIDGTSIRLTDRLGSVSGNTLPGFELNSKSNGVGVSMSGTLPKIKFSTGNAIGRFVKNASISGSIGTGSTSDVATSSLRDINGDGLADRLEDNGNAILNLGLSVDSSYYNWGYGSPNTGGSSSFNIGASVSLFNNSLSFGIGGTDASSYTSPPSSLPFPSTVTLIDINGDGLPDKIDNGTDLYYNLGTSFATSSVPITAASAGSIPVSNETEDMSASANGSFTMCGYIIIPFVGTGPKMCGCGTLNGGLSINSNKMQVTDINGDGFQDIVTSDAEDNLTVRYSNIGRTNMLKTVHRPLGATINMDYAVTNMDGSKNGNTYRMPFSKWAMTSVVVNDGHSGDGEDNMTNKFEYFNGVQDRRERTFLGFGIVKTHRIDVNDNIYTTSVNEYATANIPDSDLYVGCLDNRVRQYFYKKGIVTKTYMIDGLGREHSETNYTFKYFTPNIIPTPTSTVADYNMLTTTTIHDATSTFDSSSFTDNSRVLPLMVSTDSKVWEFDSETAGAASSMKEQFNSIDKYDKYGNIKQYQDKGASLSDISDDIKVTMLYYYNPNNVVNVPLEHRVTNQGVVFRLSRNFIDHIGKITSIRKYLTTSLTSNYALYDMKYDQYGNLTSIYYPKGVLSGSFNTRMSYNYTFDPITQTYPIKVDDAYGYSSSTEYYYDLGVIKSTTDLNGKIISYKYDSFGRTVQITGPYQTGGWTIQNSYFPSNSPPLARTAHFDNGGIIYTSTFIDGLERVIQTKKELQNCSCDLHNIGAVYRLSVSGKIYYDEFGRAIDTYLNNEESSCDGPKGALIHVLSSFSNFTDDPNQRTNNQYDYLDRLLTTTVFGLSSGDATTQISYTFGPDRNSVTQFMKQVTQPNGNVSQTFTDSKGRTTSSNQIGNGETYWTSFEYNKLNELLNIKDANQAITYYTYDNFGRKLSVNHPDSGMSTFKYDLASHLKESTNANLASVGQKVLFKYNFNQLTDIIYPSHTVTYKYGQTGDPDNGAGRIIYQSDLTGEQFFKYGSLGEINENTRTVIDPLGTSRTFVTDFSYDTWGRIRKLVYPDGEVVVYTYDSGGLLTHMENADGQVYLKSICYDKFEQRATVVYGNNTVTNYNYEPQQLLSGMTVASSAGSLFMNNRYNYDLNRNVTQIDNSASAIALYHLGGTESKTFKYDDFNRLTHSEGIWNGENEDHNFKLDMEYNSLHNILSKMQSHQVAPVGTGNFSDTHNSMSNYYSYTGGNQPHAPSTIDVFDPNDPSTELEQINNTYDLNGNLQLISHDDLSGINNSTTRELYWDEQNRLQAIVDVDVAYNYVYDASSERILKSSGSTSNLVVNGSQVVTLTNPGAYTMYPSGYLVVGDHDYTKHYYSGSQRIASRIGDLSLVNNFESFAHNQGSTSTDKLKQKAKLDAKRQVLQKQLTQIYAKAKLGKPNFIITQAAIDPAEAACEAQYNTLLQYWYTLSQNSSNNADLIKICISQIIDAYNQTNSYCQAMSIIQKGSRCYVDIETKNLPIWWYHPDHLGSSSYLTDYSGAPSHYYDYLPFGEEMVSQNNSTYNNVYKFSGKEFDEDTGLSYFGARYYDPKWSVWLSTDPLAEKMPSWSPYNFCKGNPLRLIDPDGRSPQDIVVTTKDGKKLFTLDDGKKAITTMTVNQLYKTGTQWFEPLADNYMPLKSTEKELSTTDKVKHFTSKDVLAFSHEDRWMTSYRQGGSGDWKVSEKGADGFLLSTVDNKPFWSDAIGQIPFAVNRVTDDIKSGMTRYDAIIETIQTGKEYGEGKIFGGKVDNSNTYDNYFILRGAANGANGRDITRPVTQKEAETYGL